MLGGTSLAQTKIKINEDRFYFLAFTFSTKFCHKNYTDSENAYIIDPTLCFWLLGSYVVTWVGPFFPTTPLRAGIL